MKVYLVFFWKRNRVPLGLCSTIGKAEEVIKKLRERNRWIVFGYDEVDTYSELEIDGEINLEGYGI